MPFTPAHIAAVRNKFETQQKFDWKRNMGEVKKLYRECKYKLCAALCEDIIAANMTIHPLHKTFFHFYQAICYESLGVAAHDYSSNKLSFFDHAKDAFSAALATLPLPFATDEDGRYNDSGTSPMAEDSMSSYSTDEAAAKTPTTNKLTPRIASFLPRTESYISITCSDNDSGSDSDNTLIPDFNDYSPRDSFNQLVIIPKIPRTTSGLLTPNHGLKSKEAIKARLSQSLSNNHVIEEALIPSPLFNRKPKLATIASTIRPIFSQSITTSGSRPLPRLPFDHSPTFVLNGTRHVQVPRFRKTALHPQLTRAPLTPSPVTARFAAIRDAFTPSPSEDPYLTTYLTSVPLRHYNKNLAAFRTQVLTHLASVEERIGDVETVQREHKRVGERGSFASHWSFQAPGEETERAKKDSKAREKVDRIKRLREAGWQVKKEQHGWKGVPYYEELRRKAEAELYPAAVGYLTREAATKRDLDRDGSMANERS